MSTSTRKARKRAGAKLVKPPKTPTYTWYDANESRGIGLTTGPEILASIVVKGI